MKLKTLSQVIREVNRKFALSKEATLALEASQSLQICERNFQSSSSSAPATITRWLSKIDCGPGFTKQSNDSIRNKSEDFKRRCEKTSLCALMLTEMCIKKELVCDRHTQMIWGYTDIGTEIEISNKQELTTEALVLMVVGINDNFKIPIDFFVNKISGEEEGKYCLGSLETT
ncbi:hypothetical protein JTB14_027543 [Gonioctena quinquepunctata]|nr:hypothetical protein JTB14_027543 [Gonioctena quinquepunctata]